MKRILKMFFFGGMILVLAVNVMSLSVIAQTEEEKCDISLAVYLDSLESDDVVKTDYYYLQDGGFSIYPDKTTVLNYSVVIKSPNIRTGVVVQEIACYYDSNLEIIECKDFDFEIVDSVIINSLEYNKLLIKNIALPYDTMRQEISLKFETPIGYDGVFNNFYSEITKGDSNYIDEDSIPGNAINDGLFNTTNEDDASAFLNEYNLLPYPYGLKFKIENETAKIIDYLPREDVNVLCIPSKIYGYPVTDIESAAFKDRTSSIECVFIPSSVKNILTNAFENTQSVASMKKIMISEGVNWIGGRAFYNCTNLEYINLPESVNAIKPTIISSNKFYGSFLSESLYLYSDCPNPSIKDINVIEGSYADSYLSGITYNDVATFNNIISYGKKLHTVHYDVATNGGEWNFTETRPAFTGETIDFSLFASKKGNNFIGWNTDPFATEGLNYLEMGDSDVVLYAIFEKNLISISVQSMPHKTIYELGETLNISGLKLKLTYSDGTTEIITTGFETSGLNSGSTGLKAINVKYDGLETTFTVNVVHSHNYINKITKQPTCTETGVETLTCECGDSQTKTIPAKGHTEVSVTGKAETCTETGLTDGKKCSVCGTTTVSQQTIPAKGHTTSVINKKSATCTVDGYTGDTYCSTCKTITVKGSVIKATSHKWNDGSITMHPTCTTPGEKTFVCKDCYTSKSELISAKGHKETVVGQKDATENEAGYTGDKICSVCNKVTEKGKEIPKLGVALATPVVTVKNSGTGVKVTWNAVENAEKYIVCSKTYNAKTKEWTGWENRETVTATSWTDTSAKSGTKYKYTVKALNGDVKSGIKSSSSILFLAQPTVKIANASTGVKVKWNKITGAKGYKVYRAEYINGKWSGWKSVKTIDKGSTVSYTDKSAKSGVKYKYTVKAVNGKTASTYKSSSSLLYLAQPKTTVKAVSNGVKVSWTQITGATSYKIYRSEYNTKTKKWGSWKTIKTAKSTSKSYTDKTAKKGVKYRYAVKAVNGKVASSYKASSSVKR